MLIIFFKQDFSDVNPVINLWRYRRKLKLPGHCFKTTQFKESSTEEAVVGLEDI